MSSELQTDSSLQLSPAPVSSAARTYTIAVLPGDGVGPEVTGEAVRVLRFAETRMTGMRLNFITESVGAGEFLRSGDPLPDDAFARCRQADAAAGAHGFHLFSPYR